MTAPIAPAPDPQAAPSGLPAQPPPPPPMPWTPFPDRPNDQEPAIAQRWSRRLSAVMSTVKYAEMPVEWQQCLNMKYERAQAIVAQAQAALAAAPPKSGASPGPEPAKPESPAMSAQSNPTPG